MNKKQFLTVCLSLLACLLSSCRDEMAEVSPEEQPDGSIVLTINTESKKKARTILTGSHDLHHVRQVYAVLYKGSGETASYVCHQILTNPDGSEWNPMSDTNNYGNGKTQSKEFSLTTSVELTNGYYTLLCIGLDDQSGDVYDLTLDATHTPEFCNTGKSLADAKAILAANKKTHEAELFAGWETFSYNRNAINQVQVDLRRRVAGVYAYLKDIPVLIAGDTVKSIRLALANTPNSQIPLKSDKRPADSKEWSDFGNTPQTDETSKILNTLDMKAIANPNTSTGLYMIKKEYTDKIGLSPFTIIMGAYILPQETNTLCVQALGTNNRILKEFYATMETNQNIAFRPNHVYHIGTRDFDSDRPATLAGDRLTLKETPWNEISIETDFPTVPVNAVLGSGTGKNNLKYIYDCINTTDTLIIVPSLLQKNWTLTVAGVKENEDKTADIGIEECNWIYFIKKKADGTTEYVQQLKSEDFENGNKTELKIPFIMNDYLKKGLWTHSGNIHLVKEKIKKDWRKAKILLHTADAHMYDSIPIRQYNAIQVMSYESYGSIGFSRYDFGVERDADGNVIKQGFKGQWGYTRTAFAFVYHDETDDRIDRDGKFCYNNIRQWSGAWGDENTPLEAQPAVRFSKQSAYELFDNNGKIENAVADEFWYLPSCQELYDFFNDVVVNDNHISGVKVDDIYWSATAARIDHGEYTSYCQKLLPDGKLWQDSKDNWTKELRSELGYARRARHYAD